MSWLVDMIYHSASRIERERESENICNISSLD